LSAAIGPANAPQVSPSRILAADAAKRSDCPNGKPTMINQVLSGRRDAMRWSNSEAVKCFIVDCCYLWPLQLGEHHRDLRAAYVRWCDENDATPMTELAFTNALIAVGYADRTTTAGRRIWSGLQLMKRP
jgi:hypothetical protein